MEKLFDDSALFQKQRPTSITKQQEEEMYMSLAKQIVNQGYSTDPAELISEDLKDLSLNDSGYEMAKSLERRGKAFYEIDSDFIAFLEGLGFEKQKILTENVRTWVKAHNPQPLLKQYDRLRIFFDLSNSNKELHAGNVVYVTGIYEKDACYTLSLNPTRKGGYLVPYEKAEANCEKIGEYGPEQQA